MSRGLDLRRIRQLIDERGLTTAALARRAAFYGDDRDILVNLRDLADLSAVQLVGLADALEVTVEELLTGKPVAGRSASAGGEEAFDRPGADRAALAAALLRFGSLAVHTVADALGWTPGRFDRAIAGLYRALEPGGLTLRRGCGRLELAALPFTLPDHVMVRLARLQAEQAPLDPEEAPYLVVALRAHAVGPYPGPPWTPWDIASSLERRHAAAPIDRSRPGRPVRLSPHPDLLFALHLIRRPGPEDSP